MADIVSMQEQFDDSPKDSRSAPYDYIAFKRDAEAGKEKMATQMANDRIVFLKWASEKLSPSPTAAAATSRSSLTS